MNHSKGHAARIPGVVGIFLLAVFALLAPAVAQEGNQYPLGPIGGTYRVTGGSSAALIATLSAGAPGATAGLRVGDYIYGAFGQTFTPTGSYHYGVSQELGFAVDRAESGDGVLPLLVIRPGAGGFTANLILPPLGALGVAYPRNSAKYAAMYETAVADLHTRAMNSNGSMGYFTGWTGLALLGHPNWNSTTGGKPYRLSVNKVRDFVISELNTSTYAPCEDLLLTSNSALANGGSNPNSNGGHSNWQLGQKVMFLAEYYAKTSPLNEADKATVAAALQRGAELCGNSIQYWKQPSQTGVGGFSPEYAQVAGMNSHGGVTGDYMHQGWYCGINMTGCYSFNGMAFSRRAGMNMAVRPRDGHYFGYNVNPGDPIPEGAYNALPTSITLPQYGADVVRGATIANTSNPLNRSDASDPFWYDMSIHQKFVMQLNFLARRSTSYSGNNDDGCTGYAPEAISSYDAGGRTPGTLLGMAMYQQDVSGLDAADLDRMERLKGYITRNFMRHQEAHAYCVGAQAYQAMCAPYLSDRQQRFFMDNWRFFFALSRTPTNGLQYFPSRSVADNYLDTNHCAAINIALPYAVANGSYSLIPAYNTTRTLAHFKAPFLMWPQLAARACTVTANTQAFSVDACDGNGNILVPASYTAAWSHVSGPGTATFTPNNTANTSIGNLVTNGTYRVRLTITRAGFPTLTEDIDITRANAVVPVANTITAQPAAASANPGGSASFSVTVSGTGPMLYQWRRNGAALWGQSISSTLSLTNLSVAAAGFYDCIITTPTGTLVANAAPLTFFVIGSSTSGGLKRETWSNLGGSSVSDLTSSALFPAFPTATAVATTAETAEATGDNYGERLSGWIVPPTTGTYRFFLSSDDSSELWLSTNDSSANLTKRAELIGSSSFRSYSAASGNIDLVAGQRYYIELLHKEGGGGDHLSLAWQTPGGAQPTTGTLPIDGAYLEYESATPLTDHWKLDETTGTTAVNSIRTANNGTHLYGTLVNQTGASPGTGKSAYYDGLSGSTTGDRTSIPAPNYNTNNLTMVAWVKRNGTIPAWAPILFCRAGNTIAGFGCGDASELRYHWNGLQSDWNSGLTLPDGQWVLAALVVKPTGATIHMRTSTGLSSATQPSTLAAEEFNGTMYIGADTTANSRRFKGNIDDVRVYAGALSAADIEMIYQTGLSPAPVMASASMTVAENAAIGTAVGTVAATDSNPGQTITYSIISGNSEGRFALNPATGAITVASPPDFETTSVHTLIVGATDNGTPAQTTTAAVTIAVTNVQEAPAFASNPVVGTPVYKDTACVGTITAFDPDLGSSVTYTKLTGPPWLTISTAGALTGTPSAGDAGVNVFTVRATDNTGLTADVTLHISVINPADAPIWINPAGGTWLTAANWYGSAVANGADITADFSTLDLTDDTAVTLDGARTIGGLKFGDTMPSHNWTLSTGTSGPLTLQVASGSPVINIVNQTTTLATALAGTTGLTKTGTGLLVLAGDNTYTGDTLLSAGTLRVGAGGATGNLGGSNVTNNGLLEFYRSNALAVPQAISGTGNIYVKPGGTFTFSGPVSTNIFRFHEGGSRTVTFSGSAANTINVIEDNQDGHGNLYFAKSAGVNAFSGPVLHVGSGYASQFLVQLQNHNQIADTASVAMYGWNGEYGGRSWFRLNGYNETIAGLVGGSGTSYVQNNAATPSVLTLSGAGTYSLGGYLSNGSTGTLSLVMNGTGFQTLSGGGINYTGTTSISNGTLRLNQATGFASSTTTVNASGTLELTSTTTTADNWRINSVLTGAGVINKTGAGWVQTLTNAYTFSGNVNVSAGAFGASGTTSNWSGVTADFNVSAGALLDARGQAITIGGLNGDGRVGNTWTSSAIVTLGAGNKSGVFSGVISGDATSVTNLMGNPNAGSLSLIKTGTGTQTLSGANDYSGTTTVNAGTLFLDGTKSGFGATTVNAGATLAGTGTISGPVTVASGATLAAGHATPGTLTLTNALNRSASSTVALRIGKTGAIRAADQIRSTSGSGIAYSGTLTVTLTAGSDTLAAGDTFTLFSTSGGSLTGSFATTNLPTLGTNLAWDTSGLTLDGTIRVISTLAAAPPIFGPVAGNYVGTVSVTISSSTAGASIRYTTDGTDPATSGTAVTAATPVSGITVPVPATRTIRAYAIKSGLANSPQSSAIYTTTTSTVTAIWTNPAGGTWPLTTNWFNATVAEGAGITADFSTLSLASSPIVTLDGTPTVGGLRFGDVGGLYSWTLHAGSGGPLTLDVTSGQPSVEVVNQPVIISADLAGADGLAKTGPGMLVLTGTSNYTGLTSVIGGTLRIGNHTASGNIPAASPVDVAATATAQWFRSDTATVSVGHGFSGAGTVSFAGMGLTDTASQYALTADNSPFSGTWVLDGGRLSVSVPSQLGAGAVEVRANSQLAVTGNLTLATPVTITNSSGWRDVASRYGAIRMEGDSSLAGNIVLNHTTSIVSGDGTGLNAVLCGYAAGNHTLSGSISGPGELSMSRFTSWNGGTVQTVNFDLAGTVSNTYSSNTVVDGQGGVASLRLMKTGGAIAIPGGNTVQMGSATGGQANLRMGNTTATGATRSQWDNQFGTANGGVLLNFVNASGQWMRLDLQGTNQTLAGLNAGTLSTQGGAVIQNQNLQGFDPGQDATLTLIGSGTYLYHGYLRNQDNGGTTRKLNLVWNGTGTQTLCGSAISYTGTTSVSQGKLVLTGSYGSPSLSIASGAALELSVTSGTTDYATSTISGAGTLLKTGAGTARWGTQAGTFALGAGALVDVREGTLDAGSSANENWSANLSSLNVNSGAAITEVTYGASVFDALTGAGSISGAGSFSLTIGANNTAAGTYNPTAGTATFSGVISSVSSLIKTGTGSQILSGASTYTGTTAVNQGKLLVTGSLANTLTTVAAAGTLGGTGTLGGATTVNGTLAPGTTGVGTLTINAATTLAPASAIAWELADWTGTNDKVVATSLNLTATSAARCTIRLTEQALANFSETSKTFLLVQTTSGISGYAADKFTVDASALTTPAGTWAVQQSGNNLVLAYTPPNPDANGNGILDSWEIVMFGNANPGSNLPLDDADKDGSSNFLEYGLDTNPTLSGASPLIQDLETVGADRYLRLTVPKNPLATNLTYTVEVCGNLQLAAWTASQTLIEVNTSTQLRVRDTVPITAGPRFMRLKVTAPP